MSLHPTHPPNPTHVLRSIEHVCNFNYVITPHPPTQPNPRDRREGKCIETTVYSGRSTFGNASLRPTGAKNKIAKPPETNIAPKNKPPQ